MYRLITIVGVLILSMLEVVAPDTLVSISINRHLGSGSQSTTINSPGTPACGDGYLATKVQLNGDQPVEVDTASCKYLNFRGTYWYNGFHFLGNVHDDCGGAGINTSGWIGIGKLNQVSYCDVGHLSGDDDNTFIDFSRYHDNYSDGLQLTGGGNYLSHKTISEASDENCSMYFEHGSSYLHNHKYLLAYDTLRYGIEHCYDQKQLAPWGYFGVIDEAVNGIVEGTLDSEYWVSYREWLKGVLYLDTAWYYYCSDVNSIMHTMAYFPGHGTDFGGYISIFKYVIESGKCPAEFFPDHDSLWRTTRRDEYQFWRDTVTDTLQTPFDTTLPTIDELGLQILRGPQFGDVAVSPSTVDHDAIVTLVAKENPFTNEAVLRYTLRSTAALRLEIFDALGKRMYSDAIGFRGAGEYTSAVPAIGWSRGTYYARLSSLTGGVLTVKLIKN